MTTSEYQNTAETFTAPWSPLLKVMTGGITVLVLGIAAIGIFSGPRESLFWILSMVVTPIVIVGISALFTIRGYTVKGSYLYVKRLLWDTVVDLSSLTSVEFDPQATANSWRTFGNGGLFSFSGMYRNKRLGSYRMFATDQSKSVVLQLDGKTIVVTPDDPETLTAVLKRYLSGNLTV